MIQNYREGNDITSSQPSQQNHQQQQSYQQLNAQSAEQLLLNRFYLYKNLEYLINLIYAYQTIKENFKDPKHDMVVIALNKIILQLNISNATHYEMQQSSKDQLVIQDLDKQKQNAGQIFVEIFKNLKNEEIKKELAEYFKSYLESLYKDMKLKQFPIVQTQRKNQFDQRNMQIVDKQIQDLKITRMFDVPKKEELFQKAQNYQQMALQQISKNFPNETLNKSKNNH